MKIRNLLIVVLFVVALILIWLFFSYYDSGITGSVIFEDAPHYTKAICDGNNFCQDYMVYCEDGELVRTVAIDGAVIQHFDDWVDPRGEDADVLC